MFRKCVLTGAHGGGRVPGCWTVPVLRWRIRASSLVIRADYRHDGYGGPCFRFDILTEPRTPIPCASRSPGLVFFCTDRHGRNVATTGRTSPVSRRPRISGEVCRHSH